MSSKQTLKRLERDLKASSTDGEAIKVSVNWRDDDLIEFECEDGSIELITKDQFKDRGGILVEWPDDSEVH